MAVMRKLFRSPGPSSRMIRSAASLDVSAPSEGMLQPILGQPSASAPSARLSHRAHAGRPILRSRFMTEGNLTGVGSRLARSARSMSPAQEFFPRSLPGCADFFGCSSGWRPL